MARLLTWVGNNSEEIILNDNKIPTTFFSTLGAGETIKAQVRGFDSRLDQEIIPWTDLYIRGNLIALAEDNNHETLQGPIRIRWVRSIGTLEIAIGDPYDP